MDRSTQNKAIELYKKGLTVYEVGAELGLSYVTIWNILKNNDISNPNLNCVSVFSDKMRSSSALASQ